MNTVKQYTVNLTASQLFKVFPYKTRNRLGKKVFKAILDFYYEKLEHDSSLEFDINEINNWVIYDNIKSLYEQCSRFYDFGKTPTDESEMETILIENGVWLFHFKNKVVTLKC